MRTNDQVPREKVRAHLSIKAAQYDKELRGSNRGKRELELVIEGFRGTDRFKRGVGWVGGSIHSHNSHVGHVAFQTESLHTLRYWFKHTSRNIPLSLSMRTEDDGHTITCSSSTNVKICLTRIDVQEIWCDDRFREWTKVYLSILKTMTSFNHHVVLSFLFSYHQLVLYCSGQGLVSAARAVRRQIWERHVAANRFQGLH